MMIGCPVLRGFSPSAVACDYPAEADVKAAVVYGNTTYTGTYVGVTGVRISGSVSGETISGEVS